MTKASVFQVPLFRPDITWTAPATADLPSLKGLKRICMDTETKDPNLKRLGPGPRRPGTKIVGLALGIDNGPRFYFPTDHEGGGNMDGDQVRAWARSELNAFDGEIVGAKLDYDMDMLATLWGVELKCVRAFHDVQIAEPIIDEWRFEYSLDALSRDYLGEGKDERLLREAGAAYGLHTQDAIKENLWRLPAGYVGPYAEADTDRPLRILPLQFAKLEADDQMHIYELERQLIPLLVAMRRRGVRVDLEKAQRVRKRLVDERDKWLNELKRLAGPRAELMEPASFSKALAARGIDFPITAKTNQPSITRFLLERNGHDELCQAVMNGRKCNTMINTFIDGNILGHSINGRIHGTLNQLKGEDGGTIARFSSSDPNLQNIPARDEELGPLIRGIFVPEEDEDWESQDESQMEYRYMVHFGVGKGIEEARRQYNEDPKTDFHAFVSMMLGVPPEDKIKRKRVKSTNFAKGYGAAAPRLALTFNCSVEEAERFIKEYDEKLPFAKATYEKADEWAERRGFVVTILGRKQRFPFYEPYGNRKGAGQKPPLPREAAIKAYGPRVKRAWTYRALNRKLQGSNADHMKKAMVDAYNAGVFAPDAIGVPLLTVHDELDISRPRTARGIAAAAELRYITENCIKLNVPVIVKVERGPSWGEVKGVTGEHGS